MGLLEKLFSKNQKSDPIVVLDAVKNGDLKQIKSFLKNGIDINATYKIDEDNYGNTLLMVASFFGQTELVKYLLDSQCEINATDNKGSSALIFAALNGHFEIVDLLLSAGSDTSLKVKGVTALMLAELKGHKQIVNLIRKYEQNLKGVESSSIPDKLDQESSVENIGSFKEIKIGTQTWMVKNLDVNCFCNGDPMPEVKSNEEWERAGQEKKPAWCYFNNEKENDKKIGKLYNWYSVIDKRGLAPNGWHIPSLEEFGLLKESIKNNGNSLKEIGQGKGEGIGTNESGFSALASGCRIDLGVFGVESYTGFWSSTEAGMDFSYDMSLTSMSKAISLFYSKQKFGHSIRCIKN